jgi:hypothetical protein
MLGNIKEKSHPNRSRHAKKMNRQSTKEWPIKPLCIINNNQAVVRFFFQMNTLIPRINSVTSD